MMNSTKYDGNKLEEILFLISDLLHNAEDKKISLKQIEEIMIQARLFTRYADQNRSDLEERYINFIHYLKTDMWKQVYGKAFDEFQNKAGVKEIIVYPKSIKFFDYIKIRDLLLIDGFTELLETNLSEERSETIKESAKNKNIKILFAEELNDFSDNFLYEKEYLKIIIKAVNIEISKYEHADHYHDFFIRKSLLSEADEELVVSVLRMGRSLGIESYRLMDIFDEMLIYISSNNKTQTGDKL